MDFFELIEKRRSIRRYSAQPVPEADVRAIMEAARLAPSATNEQPWRFMVIRDRETKEAMRDMVNAVVDTVLQGVTDEARRKRIEGMRIYSTHFARAPVAIVVLARPWVGRGYASPEETAPRDLGLLSVAMATSYILLAATEKGYASCFASGPAEFARQEVEAVLGVEQPWFLVGVVSLGIAERPPGPRPSRKPLEEICTFVG